MNSHLCLVNVAFHETGLRGKKRHLEEKPIQHLFISINYHFRELSVLAKKIDERMKSS